MSIVRKINYYFIYCSYHQFKLFNLFNCIFIFQVTAISVFSEDKTVVPKLGKDISVVLLLSRVAFFVSFNLMCHQS